MIYRFFKNTFLFLLITSVSCGNSSGSSDNGKTEETAASVAVETPSSIVVGANQTEAYLPLLKGKKIGVLGNQSSVIFRKENSASEEQNFTHLVDSLLALDVEILKVFAPEHGFRGTADAGELIKDGKDVKTGLPVISLYGDNKKPTPDQLKGLDLLVFDLQDVGARFYTYISSLHYLMEACAENNLPLIILDRPNPNSHYTDGPILNMEYKSFVGMHPVPVVHGMSTGEYAQMINGEKWLKNGVQCDLRVITMSNYEPGAEYRLPVKPSPNLPNAQAVNLYPSLCFFEGTNVNAGRGTLKQFQVFGSPFLHKEVFPYSYIPESREGAKNPKHLGKTCYGKDLTEHPRLKAINLEWLITAYRNTADKPAFFNDFFTRLAGGKELQKQIEAGWSQKEIKETWQKGLEDFKEMRRKYLLY